MIYTNLNILFESEDFRITDLTIGDVYRIGYNKNPRKAAPMYNAKFVKVSDKGFAFFRIDNKKQVNKKLIYKVKNTEKSYYTSKFLVITKGID